MRELVDQLERALLDVGQEVVARRGEDRADGVRGDLLLDADGAVDIEELVDVKRILVLYVDLVGDRDRARGSETGGKVGSDVRVGDWNTFQRRSVT